MNNYEKFFEKQWMDIKIDFQKLEEEIRFSDLAKSAGMSAFTKDWRKDRNSVRGTENTTAKLRDCVISKGKGWVTWKFHTVPTYTSKGVMATSGKSMKLKPALLYKMELRILEFFKWAKTTPGYKASKQLSVGELKEIFDVANVQVWCSCPSMHWQGMAYYLSLFYGAIHPTSIEPTEGPRGWKDRHNAGDNLICKHLGGTINYFSFFRNAMVNMLNEKLKTL